MKKIMKYLGGIVLSMLFLFTNLDTLSASSASISVSSSASTVVLGNTFTVTIKVSSSSKLGTWEFTPSYDSGKFKLVSGDTSVVDYGPTSSKSYTYKFKAVGTGSGSISVKSYSVLDYDTTEEMKVSVGSKTVKVITAAEQKATYSSNNYIKEIYVDHHDGLTPSFSKTTTEYKIDVDTNTTNVNIVAITEDPKADLSGDGFHDVSEGENKFTITCIAQNGDTKNYVVIVNVVDPNPIEITIDDEKYTVVKRESSITAPDNYEKTKVTINEIEVPALYSELNDITLISLRDSKGNQGLYIYDKEKNSYSKYEEVKLSQLLVLPLPIDKKFSDNDKKENIDINGAEFMAIKLLKDFYIIHARDLTTGEDDYYRYDIKTNTMIRYDDKELTSYKKEILEYKKLIMILGAETVIIIFVLICILIAKLIKNKKRKRKIEELKERALEEERKKELEEKNKKELEEKELEEKNKKELEEKENEEETKELSKTKVKENNNKNNSTKKKKKKKKEVLENEEEKVNKGDN